MKRPHRETSREPRPSGSDDLPAANPRSLTLAARIDPLAPGTRNKTAAAQAREAVDGSPRSRVIRAFAPCLILWALLVSGGRAAGPEAITQPATVPNASIHFRAVDVFVNAGDKPLGAYQVELKARNNDTLLVGIEGGEHPAYQSAPYYDPAALMHDRVIVAAFSTAADLPHGNTRVARLMVQTTGAAEPAYDGKIEAAAAADGSPISAQLTVTPVLEGAKQ